MLNLTELEEKKYLNEVIQKLHIKLQKEDSNISAYTKDITNSKQYVWENIYELDPLEILSNTQSIHQTINSAEASLEVRRKLFRLIDSPYFARIDFKFDGEEEEEQPIYIGVYSFTDDKSYTARIYDWRAPISSMFYDFEKGEAFFEAPMGRITGEITLKRQYKINHSELEYMLESSVNINDDILQKELSKSSDKKMQNIVQTIQRDQNIIIRNTNSLVLIIQGAAGSGKTSIALHRVAFLLYKFKSTLKSNNILIISPNKIFSNYISSVLPELGEEKILEVSMEDIANNEIKNRYRFEKSYEQIENLFEKKDVEYIERIKYKSSLDFVIKMNEYIEYITYKYFVPKKITVSEYVINEEYILSRYNNYSNYTIAERLENVLEDVIQKIETDKNCRLKSKVKKQIKELVYSMFKTVNLLELYKYFYDFLGRRELLKFIGRGKLEYADVFPLIYIKLHVEGHKDFSYIKHLVIDEMQDYCPIQYEVISKLFKCNKTILGDKFQSVNIYSNSSKEIIKKVFAGADEIELCKSYRSTYEITNFAQKIIKNYNLVAIERHGNEPKIIRYGNLLFQLVKLINKFENSNYQSLGIICKTQKQATELYRALDKSSIDSKVLNELKVYNITLLDYTSIEFKSGVVITSPYIAKGLEFDQVIVVDCDDKNYHTEMDKGMLYIACTRAMHKLDILFKGTLTDFIKE